MKRLLQGCLVLVTVYVLVCLAQNNNGNMNGFGQGATLDVASDIESAPISVLPSIQDNGNVSVENGPADIVIEESVGQHLVPDYVPTRPNVKPAVEELEYEREQLATEEALKKEFDKKAKEKLVKDLVDRGTQYFAQHSIADACNKFSHTREFLSGEVYLFVMDVKGRIIAHGNQAQLIFKNLYDAVDMLGTHYVQDMIKMAQQGGGWVTYSWENAIKVSYVKQVKKDGEAYVIGAGYYPHTKADLVVSIVKGAVAFFNKIAQEGRPTREAFGVMDTYDSPYFIGDLYLYAVTFDGILVLQADRPGLEGRNVLHETDAQGKKINAEIIEKLKTTPAGDGIWVDYQSKGTIKRTYAEKVTDAQGKQYFIACGYYPEVSRKEAETLVGRAYQYMESHGKSEATHIFSNKRDNTYRYGDLYIVVYDAKGIIIAHGNNEEEEGRNAYNDVDQNGFAYVKAMIAKARAGGGWVDYKIKNAFQTTYVEEVDLGGDKYIIASGLFPVSKTETMLLLVDSAASALKSGPTKEVLHTFVDVNDAKYIRGDLKIFVLDFNGICYAWGEDNNLIWKNLLDWKDQRGRPFIQMMLEQAKQGPSNVMFEFNGRTAIAHVQVVQKPGETYVIGSSFYY